jgi:hypothetical protein
MQDETIIQLFDRLNLFIKGRLRNEWIVVDGFKMYVRKSKRFYNNGFIDCLDLATVQADVMGTGLFTKILTKLLHDYPNINIFVESIVNTRLIPFFKKFGFIEYRTDDMILIRNL